jgi:hypothetical protein
MPIDCASLTIHFYLILMQMGWISFRKPHRGSKWTNTYEHITMDEWHMDMTFFHWIFVLQLTSPQLNIVKMCHGVHPIGWPQNWEKGVVCLLVLGHTSLDMDAFYLFKFFCHWRNMITNFQKMWKIENYS